MTVTLHNYRETPSPMNQVGFDLTATNGSDMVGVVLYDVKKDTETLVTISPAASGTTPTVTADYSVSDSAERAQFIKLGTSTGITAETSIEVSPAARVLRFGTENGKAGGHVSLISTAKIDLIHTGQAKTITASPNSIALANGVTESIGLIPSHNSRLFTWEISAQSGGPRISFSEIKFTFGFRPYFDVTRLSAGNARVRVRARAFDGSTVISTNVDIT